MTSLLLHLIPAAMGVTPLVASPPPQVPSREAIAIVGARIVTMSGNVIPQGVVVIRDGKIVSVSPGTSAPAGVTAVDATGKVLYPGFIDAFTTRGLKAPPAPSEEGRPDSATTAPAFMWAGNRKGVNPDFKADGNFEGDDYSSAHGAGVTTALFSPGRGSIRGVAAVIDLLPSAVTTRTLNPNAGMGMSFRSAQGSGYPSNILGVIALMRQALSDAKSVSEGVNLAPGAEKKPAWAAGPETLRLLTEGKMPAVFEVGIDREILRAFNLADEFGFKINLTGARDAYLLVDEIKRRQVGVSLSPNLSTAPEVRDPAPNTPPADVVPKEVAQERYDRWKAQSRNAIVLAEAGIPFAWSSEGDPPGEFLTNVRAQIKNGLPAPAALAALTVNAAKLIGVADLGSIAPGMKANLVLMSGDFADDKSVVERVWVDGRPVLAPKPAAKEAIR